MAIVTDVQEAKEILEEFKRDYSNVKRVIDYLESESIPAKITMHQEAASSETAAESMDCDLNKIVKSLLFIVEDDPLLVLVQGSRQVDMDKLKRVTEAKELRLARPEEVEAHTGYKVGSVSPFDLELPTIIDAPLLEESEVRPAAGSTCAGAILTPEILLEQLPAKVEQVSREVDD